jgi:hypothetical protein
VTTPLIPLSSLKATMTPADQEFLASVIKRDQNPDGSDKGVVRRMLASTQCLECHKEFQRKHKGKPFAIKCQGIYDTPDYEAKQAQLQADGDDMSIDEIREIYDAAFWAERKLVVKTDDGDIVPVVMRPYQTATMRCTSPRKVDRWGRGMGKTLMGVALELHFICNNKNTETIVVCPAQSQAQLWWDEIKFQIENSPSFSEDFLMQSKQQPFLYMRFGNGAVLKIFTAGSKSGKGADAVRGSNPRRIRLDEQDYLSEKDYAAIMPLLRRFKKSTFHGSSTPSGLRQMYWQMCMKLPDYKEFYHSIKEHPDWGTDQLNEPVCFAEAKTMDRYRHEWLAEFGDPTAGVFKATFVDEAIKPYTHKGLAYDPTRRYFMGIDWNGKGTGTRICVVEYDPDTRIRKVMARATIDDPKSTTKMSMAKVVEMNRWWHCEDILVDAGFGFVQDELLRDLGAQNPHDPDVAKLKHIQVIDFGAKLKTNRIVPHRDPDSKYKPDPKEEELERRTKPFLVEGAVMCFEGNLVHISGQDDKLLEDQIRGYRVKTWSKGGVADTYETDAESGDHDLDALLLALLGAELKYGLWHTTDVVKRLVQIAHVSGWGLPATPVANQMVSARFREAQERVDPETTREIAREEAGIPARTRPQRVASSLQEQYRLQYLSRNSAVVAPAGGTATSLRGGGRIPSRTNVFQQGASARPIHYGSGRRFH